MNIFDKPAGDDGGRNAGCRPPARRPGVARMCRRDFVLLATGAMLAARPAVGQTGAVPLVGLREEGFEAGRNVTVEYRWAEGEYDRVPALAVDLLALKPALMVAYGPPNLLRAAIGTIPRDLPIVFGTGGDPVAAGIVANFGRPGGNATGVANRTNNLDIKRLELLRDLVPAASVIGMILNPKNSDAAEVTQSARERARALGRELVVAGASTPEQLDEAFAMVEKGGAGGLLMGSDTFLNAHSARIIALAERYRLPTIYNGRAFAERGGLISYGANFADTYRLVGGYAGKVLKGAKPADLPVLEPTRFELLVNLTTAKALGLTIPPLILGRADEVVE